MASDLDDLEAMTISAYLEKLRPMVAERAWSKHGFVVIGGPSTVASSRAQGQLVAPSAQNQVRPAEERPEELEQHRIVE